MRNKIKEALRQEYKTRLELDDERLDGVAAFAATFVTDESKIEEFVKNDATLTMLKSYQSVADKARTKALQGKDEPPKQNPDPANNPEPKPEPAPQPNPVDLAKTIADAVASAIKPISDELTKFKTEQAAKSALASAEAMFKGNDYVKKYTEEGTTAWKIANDLNTAKGGTMTAEELNSTAMEYFNTFVKSKGVDTSKPFESEGGGGGNEPDFSSFDAAAKSIEGFLPENNQPNS